MQTDSLLFHHYHEYLNFIGIEDKNMVDLALGEAMNVRYHNPMELDAYMRGQIADKTQRYYVFIDEIQKVFELYAGTWKRSWIFNYTKESLKSHGLSDSLLGAFTAP